MGLARPRMAVPLPVTLLRRCLVGSAEGRAWIADKEMETPALPGGGLATASPPFPAGEGG